LPGIPKTVVKLKAIPCLHPDSHHPIFPFYLYESGRETDPQGHQIRLCGAEHGAGFDSLSGAVARFSGPCLAQWRGC
jgi:hypothetical protein